MEENKIKEARLKTKLSQDQFSQLLKIPLPTLKKWEQGVRTPPEYVENLVIYYLKKEKII